MYYDDKQDYAFNLLVLINLCVFSSSKEELPMKMLSSLTIDFGLSLTKFASLSYSILFLTTFSTA